jgi:hypothetical protein
MFNLEYTIGSRKDTQLSELDFTVVKGGVKKHDPNMIQFTAPFRLDSNDPDVAQDIVKLPKIDKRKKALHQDENDERTSAMPIYTGDFETDPFKHGEMIDPFAAGFYDGTTYVYFWGKDCVEQFFLHLKTVPPGVIYFHNLGGFDFFWMIKHLTGKAMIRGSRFLYIHCEALGGQHQLRDSFAIMPFGLGKYKKEGKKVKLDIEIDKLTKARRNENKEEILEYLRIDCVALHELCVRFRERFGTALTVGSAAYKELNDVHRIQTIKVPLDDELLRHQFFYGGRVQCFKSGNVKQKFNIYDVNSMYPFVMKTYKHPVCELTNVTKKIGKQTCFVTVEGWNSGAFPYREEDGSLTFEKEYGIFSVSIHEWNAAQNLGLFKCKKILGCYNFDTQITFEEYIDKFYSLRKAATDSGDDVMALFYKYILNSSYGKFAQNPQNFCDYVLKRANDKMEPTYQRGCYGCSTDACEIHWKPDIIFDDDGLVLWSRVAQQKYFNNVATASSITGAARSVLLEAIAKSVNPLYCDTDSIVCEDLRGVTFSSSELGAWKNEGSGTRASIAGKKLYALFNGSKCIKQANKGSIVTPEQIEFIASDAANEILYVREAPTLKLDGTFTFLHRTIRMTV